MNMRLSDVDCHSPLSDLHGIISLTSILMVLCLFISTGVLTPLQVSAAPDDNAVSERVRKRRSKEAKMKWSNAESSYLTQNYDTARKLYLEIAKNYPDTNYGVRALGRIGDVYLAQEQYGQAIDFFRRMTTKYEELDPKRQKNEDVREAYIRTRYQIGAAYYDQKKYRRVFGTLRRFIKDFPGSKYADVAYFLIGESHLANKNYRSAIEAFDSVGTAQGSKKGKEQMPAVSPGEMLHMQVQDPDMRAAGMRETLQVRVKSSSGDVEKIYLTPRGLKSSKFVGHIRTTLGAPLSTAPLEDAWSIGVKREIERLERESEKTKQKSIELRQRRKDLEERLNEVAADDSLSGQERVDKTKELEAKISDLDDSIAASERVVHQNRQKMYKMIDDAYATIEKFLKKNVPDHTIKAAREKLKKAEEESDKKKDKKKKEGKSEQQRIIETREAVAKTPTNKSNFEKRKKVLEKWTDELYHDIKHLEVSGNDTITALYQDQHVSSGSKPEIRKSKVGIASDAYVAFTDDKYKSEVQQQVYGSPTFVKVEDPDRDISDKRDTLKVVLSVVDKNSEEEKEGQEGEEGEETEEEGQEEEEEQQDVGQRHGGHTGYIEGYVAREEREIKKVKTEDGKVEKKVVDAEEEKPPPLVPEGAPHAKVKLKETEKHSGVFVTVQKSTAGGIKVGDKRLAVGPAQLLRAAYDDEKNISRRKPWVVWAAVSFVPSSEARTASPEMEDAPLTRQAKLEKGVSEGKLAQIYEELGLNKMAQSYYESALQTCAQVAEAEGLTTLGQRATQAIWRLYFKKGEPEKAIKACEQIVQKFPESDLVSKAYLTMGEALMQQAEDVEGEGEEAEKERSGYASRAIRPLQRLQKTDADKDSKAKALYNIGKALYMTGQDGSQELEKVVKKYPDTIYAPKALALSGRKAYQNGDFTSAHEYFTRVVMTYPNAENIAEVMFLRANSLVKQGNYSDAMQAYTELLENYPGSTYAKKAQKIKSAIRKKMGG